MARKGLEFGWVLWSGRITDAVCEQSRYLERVWEGVWKGKWLGRGRDWEVEGEQEPLSKQLNKMSFNAAVHVSGSTVNAVGNTPILMS